MSTRLLALVIPDWSAVAAALDADLAPTAPAAVMHAGRVVSATAQARVLGVDRGQRMRTARGLCPEIVLASADPEREARLFAPVTASLEGLIARFTVLGPGAVGVPAESLRYAHADESAAVEALLDRLTTETGWEFLPGIADTAPAALLAAHRSHRVLPGETPAFLASLPVSALEVLSALDETVAETEVHELISLLERLGIETLGDLAALASADVGTRMGELGLRCRRIARGEEARAPLDHLPDHERVSDLQVDLTLDPPTPRTDVLSFRARAAAAQLFAAVRTRSQVCTQVTVRLQAVSGQTQERTWRLEDMDEARVADRVRWQAEGWQTQDQAGAEQGGGRQRRGARSGHRQRGRPVSEGGRDPQEDDGAGPGEEGIAVLTLIAAEVSSPLAAQRALIERPPIEHASSEHVQFDISQSADGAGEAEETVARSLERLQGLFGPDAVCVPGIQGGRDPEETALWTPWQQTPHPSRDPHAPWPGALPHPQPVLLLRTPVELLDAEGHEVAARPAGLDSTPAVLRVPGARTHRVIDHSAAWPVDTGWWEPAERRYMVRLQVLTEDGSAFLLCKEQGQWRLLGEYA